ncbi:hypothetical protein COY16_00135 [Candidatus Roizmanbacteria bacterium CG_4_10_14_0_2_um_filter_39_13]|uniref:Shikimate kinase n=1 Tax=Candidatus Roizmanbacteria bacterium CG_4_10_14_0_2_um_filter_39_13 TaxID=1974825 RepID=A0A2M7U1Y9_9BACT|nr:MAG: hypothetical protein COY16_00135 [Candidatus Roizmanbacteria bacterium CG_4_10_14_0_2_um_filter_39_13]
MIISLIGMSSAGKTYWAKRIEEEGYLRLSCDDIIEDKLQPELSIHGYSGLADVAEWMGFPYEDYYQYTSKKYLEAEEEAMNDILNKVEKLTNGSTPKIVVDTTGSGIYTSAKVQSRLKQLTEIIYLEIPKEQKGLMAKEFIRDPKPLIWGDKFNLQPFENPKKALIRCYPDLLEYRSKQYEKLADFTIKYKDHKSNAMDADRFIRHISSS